MQIFFRFMDGFRHLLVVLCLTLLLLSLSTSGEIRLAVSPHQQLTLFSTFAK